MWMDAERMARHKHNRTFEGKRHTWQVTRLWDLARTLPATEVSLAEFEELNRNPWFGGDWPPTIANVVLHCRRIMEADLSFPVILNADGRVMDGMHRLAKAMLEGNATIKAVRFVEMPEADEVREA